MDSSGQKDKPAKGFMGSVKPIMIEDELRLSLIMQCQLLSVGQYLMCEMV